jgi:nicotinamidase-related amidase
MTTALLLIDLQNDYFAGGRMPLAGPEAAVAQAAQLLAAFRSRGAPVVHVQHLARRADATFFLPGTPGADIHAAVAPESDEPVIVKHYPNAFRETALAEQLQARGVDALVVAGMMTHMCIDTSVRAAADRGLRVTLAQDACATRELAFGGVTVPAEQVQAAYLAALNGSFAQVKPAAQILHETPPRG